MNTHTFAHIHSRRGAVHRFIYKETVNRKQTHTNNGNAFKTLERQYPQIRIEMGTIELRWQHCATMPHTSTVTNDLYSISIIYNCITNKPTNVHINVNTPSLYSVSILKYTHNLPKSKLYVTKFIQSSKTHDKDDKFMSFVVCYICG